MIELNTLIYILIFVVILITIYNLQIKENLIENFKKIINITVKPNQIIRQPQIVNNRPRVIVPLYSPWRMYYPLEDVYSYNYNMFYPFYDQYNILGRNYPYYYN
jgi:hypothetical protein